MCGEDRQPTPKPHTHHQPENRLLDADGHIKVADMGFAKVYVCVCVFVCVCVCW